MKVAPESLPSNLAAARAMILAERAAPIAARARAVSSSTDALIARRASERHLQHYTGILQADGYSGNNTLCDPSRAQAATRAIRLS